MCAFSAAQSSAQHVLNVFFFRCLIEHSRSAERVLFLLLKKALKRVLKKALNACYFLSTDET